MAHVPLASIEVFFIGADVAGLGFENVSACLPLQLLRSSSKMDYYWLKVLAL